MQCRLINFVTILNSYRNTFYDELVSITVKFVQYFHGNIFNVQGVAGIPNCEINNL